MAALPTVSSDYTEPSASALELYALCPARAIGRYVNKIKEPDNERTAAGKAAHKHTQHWMVTGEMVRRSSPVAAAVRRITHALPVGVGDVEPRNIERIVLLEHQGISFQGKIDWEHRSVGDLKFTGQLANIADKDPLKDMQRILYASDWFYRNPYGDKCRTDWTASQFDGERAKNYPVLFSRRQARRLLDNVVMPVANALLNATSKGADWRKAPKNASACDKYPPNGCPMREHGCKMSAREALLTLKPRSR